MIDKEKDDFLGKNIKGLMMSLIGQWNIEMDAGRAKTEFADIRPSDMRVFGQLRGQPKNLSDIHREMGFSRQAAQQAVTRLVGHGVVRVEAAANSQRDKTVYVTEQGQRLRTLAADQIGQIEAACAEAIGESDRETLRALLQRLVAAQR